MRFDDINQSQGIVAKEEPVGTDPKQSAGTSVHHGASLNVSQESGDEIARHAISGCEAHHAIAGADMRMTRSMKRHQERAAKERILRTEIREAQRRTMGGECRVGSRYALAGGKRKRSRPKLGIGIGARAWPPPAARLVPAAATPCWRP